MTRADLIHLEVVLLFAELDDNRAWRYQRRLEEYVEYVRDRRRDYKAEWRRTHRRHARRVYATWSRRLTAQLRIARKARNLPVIPPVGRSPELERRAQVVGAAVRARRASR